MKNILYIDQEKAIQLGIKNTTEAHIFDLLTNACGTWPDTIIKDGIVYYWIARQAVVRELPLVNISDDSVYRYYKSLSKLGLIGYTKDGKKDLIRITKKGKKYIFSSMSEKIPNSKKDGYVGKKSEKKQNSEKNPIKLGKNSENDSEKNPTYKTTNTNQTTNTNTNGAGDYDESFSVKNNSPGLSEIKDFINEKKWEKIIKANDFFKFYEEREWARIKNWKITLSKWVDSRIATNIIVSEISSYLSSSASERKWKTDIAYTVYSHHSAPSWASITTESIGFEVRRIQKIVVDTKLKSMPKKNQQEIEDARKKEQIAKSLKQMEIETQEMLTAVKARA